MYRLTSVEELESAKRWFDRYLPESAIISQWLKVTIDRPEGYCGTTTTAAASDDSPVVVYVNAWPKPEIIAGFDLQPMFGVENYPRVSFFARFPDDHDDDAKHENIVREFFNRLNRHIIRVTEIGGVMLRAIDERWRPLMETIYARDFNLNSTVRHWPCAAYLMSEDERNRLRRRRSIVVPPAGFEFGPLTSNDAEYVDSVWQHRITGGITLSWARSGSASRLAAFEMTEGTLGIMNHLYTVPEFRRRGLGTLVEQRLAQILLEQGHLPCKTVLRGNESGQAITDAASGVWQYFGDVFWAAYGDEKMTENYKIHNL